jgi:competence ComEA-like helix-hairpin-helix protein
MANGYFERGEIYQIRATDDFGCETGVFRPGLIVSSNAGNNASPVVNMLYMTTKDHRDHLNFETYATGRRSFVLCNQMVTIDKRRLGNQMGTLSSSEMSEIDRLISEVLDLDSVSESMMKAKDLEISARETQITEQAKEIAELKAKVENIELSCKIESAMWQKLYEKALAQVVEMKFAADLGRRVPVVEEAVVEVEVEEEEEVIEDRVDINSCTITALRKIGFNPSVAKKIVDGRPYKSVDDLKGVSGIKATHFRIMEPKLCCKPVVEEQKIVRALVEPDVGHEAPQKVNVNTVANAKQLHDITGISYRGAMAIIQYRKENGPFTCLEDLLKVEGFGRIAFNRYQDRLEV